MAPKKGRTWRSELGVVGLRFRWKKDGREALARMVDKSGINGIRLVREPDNRADPNAIMVMLPLRLMDGRQLGYLHRQVAEVLAPWLDGGSLEVVSAKLVNLDPAVYGKGTLDVTFREVEEPAKPKKPATKGKPAKA